MALPGSSRSFINKASLVALLLVCPAFLASVQDVAGAESSRYKIFKLEHITPLQAKEYLSELRFGTVSVLPGTPAVLVTAEPALLQKAGAVLDLVDSPDQYVVRTISLPPAAQKLPAVEKISGKLPDVTVGTFSSIPARSAPNRTIIDSYNGYLVLVAPADKLERISQVIEQLQKQQQAPAKQPAKEPSAPAPPTPPTEQAPSEPAGLVPKVEHAQPEPNEPNAILITAQQGKAAGRMRLYHPKPIENGEQVLKINLPEKVQVEWLVELVGKYLQLDFLYDPTKIKGEVTLKLGGMLRGPLKVKDLYPLLESVLKFKGLAMTRKGKLVTIVPIAEALEYDPALIEPNEPELIEPGDVLVTRIFELKHIDIKSAQNLLSGMKLGTSISAIDGAKLLIVTGYAYRMPRVERLLQMVDKPGKPKQFRFRQLKYTMAGTLAQKVKTLAEQLGTVPISIGVTAAAKPTVSPRRPGESTAAYQARLQREAAARAAAARSAAAAAPTTAAQAGVYLDADERTNRILMIGLDEQLDLVDELIDALDVEQQDVRALKLYRIEHVDAEEVRKKLTELGIITGTTSPAQSSSRITAGSRTPTTTTTPKPTPSATRTTTTTQAATALVEEPQVVVIESTNSLLVNATAEQHAQIQTIIGYVDQEPDREALPYVIYPLENQKPEDLAAVLEKLIQETIKDKEGKIQQVIRKTEEEITIVPDENTFSLIVHASRKNQEWIGNLIKTLDKRRPQVLIDVTLVEISKTENFEYDLNLIESFPDLTATSGLTGVIKEGVTTPDILSKLSTSGRDRFIDLQSRPKEGIALGFYADKHINALLEAIQSKNYGRILAKPKILVNDNETGTIKTTDTTYVVKKSSIPLQTGGAGQQATLVETAIDYEGYDAGITLDITPHISEGNLLRLEIQLTRSDFGAITGDKPPDTTSSDINTVVTVPDGSTIILGGMLKLNQSKGGSKIPLLGDIPLVGGLFRSVSNSDLQRKLYVFVRAEIIRPAEVGGKAMEDLERISDRNREAFEKFEREFQEYENWPGFKPEPIEPAKVLEAH